MTDDRELDTILRSGLTTGDLPSSRIAEIRDQARLELRHDRGRTSGGLAIRRGLEAVAILALGAIQIGWAVIQYLDRPY